MKLILYQENNCSIKTSLRDMTYNHIRSHHYVIFKLARELKCTDVLDGTPGLVERVSPGSDLYYTLREFSEFSFRSALPSDFSDSISILFHSQVTKHNYSRLYSILLSSPYFIYYNSDPEFNDTLDKVMFLKFIKDNPSDKLSKLFYSRCLCILTAFPFMVNELSCFGKFVIYIPQVINPNIPRITSEKFYDLWMINTTPFHKHLSDNLVKEGISILMLTPNADWTPDIDCIECKTGGLSLDILLGAVSMCKYYFGSYPTDESQDLNMHDKYSSWNHTFKGLECYYANSYLITPNKNYRQLVNLVRSNEYRNQKSYNRFIESKFSFSNYLNSFKKLLQICRGAIE